MGILDNLVKRFLEQATIIHKAKLSDAAYHIRLQSEGIKSAEFTPGYFLRLGVGVGNDEASFKDKVRSYTVWDIDKANGTLDIAIATHSNGIGANWVKNCAVGTTVSLTWKKGKFLIDNSADSYLMIGDLSALSHLYIINRHLNADKQLESIIYSQAKGELFPDVDGKSPFNFYELPQNPYKSIIEKVAEILPKMKGNKMVYIAGDSRLCVALNQYFRKELNWNSTQIKTKPFWNPEKKGLE